MTQGSGRSGGELRGVDRCMPLRPSGSGVAIRIRLRVRVSTKLTVPRLTARRPGIMWCDRMMGFSLRFGRHSSQYSRARTFTFR